MATVEEQITATKPYQKTLDAIQLVNAGMSIDKALQAVNYKKDIRPETISRFKQKLKKYTLTAPAMQKLAHHAVKDCLTDTPITQVKKDKQGNEIVEEIAPTWTNKLAAAAMVYDRVEPVVRQVQSINIDITAINLDDYRNGLACDMQGVSTHNTQVIDIKG